MKSEGLKYFTNTELTLVALIIFLAVFVGVVFWVFHRSRKTHYKKMSQLPLKDQHDGGAAGE